MNQMSSMISANSSGAYAPTRNNLTQKKIKFYPEMAKISKKDEKLFNFLVKDFGDPFDGKNIDPDAMNFNCPDFGFDNFLIFDEKKSDGGYS